MFPPDQRTEAEERARNRCATVQTIDDVIIDICRMAEHVEFPIFISLQIGALRRENGNGMTPPLQQGGENLDLTLHPADFGEEAWSDKCNIDYSLPFK